MRETRHAGRQQPSLDRRNFLAAGAASLAGAGLLGTSQDALAQAEESPRVVTPPSGKRILLVVQAGNDPSDVRQDESLAERLALAAEAGFDGVDLDQAGGFTPEQARDAVRESGVFVHNAINHAHWSEDG